MLPRPRLRLLEILLLLAPLLVLAVLWRDLPERVPIHWNIHGKVDGWSSRSFGMLLLPATNVLAYLLLLFLPRLDPRMRKNPAEYEKTLAVFGIVRLTFVAFFAFFSGLQIAAAMGLPVDVVRLTINGVLVLFLIMGNFFGNLRPNYFIGVRTPWTLESPETWRATHRVCGRMMVFGSLLLLLFQFAVPNFVLLAMVFFVGLAVWGYGYSWWHYRNQSRS